MTLDLAQHIKNWQRVSANFALKRMNIENIDEVVDDSGGNEK